MCNILDKLKNRIRRKKKTMAGFMAFCLVVTSFALPSSAVAVETSKEVSCENPFDEASMITCLGEEYDKRYMPDEISLYSAGGYNVENEFSEAFALFGKVVSTQMDNYLYDLPGIKAECNSIKDDTCKSAMTFDLSDYSFYEDDDLMTMVISTLADYPEFGCLYSKVSYYYMGNSNGNRITRILIKSPYESSELKEITLDYVNRLKSFINVPLKDSSMSTMEKMLYVHDKIVVQADYIDDGTPYSHIASNILMKGQGVCQSYAGIFNNAMSMLGIDCIYVMSDSHAWNAVRIDGLWYYVDVTWDDPVGVSDRSYTSHQYFLVKKNEFSHSHELENSSNNIYGRILNNMGGAYDNCLVKQTSAKPFWYINGLWYYVSYDKVYTWDGIDDKSQLFRGISPASNVNLAARDMKLYYSDNEGLHVYDVESGSKEKLSSGQYIDMYIDEDVIICRSISGDVFKYDMEAPAEPTREPGASTETPVEPTRKPGASTETPVEPTKEPGEPTEEPGSTDPTKEPTEAPGEPTEAPGSVDPTKEPADPTKEPTEAPGKPTEAPGSADPTKEPTEAPGKPTETPGSAEPTMTPLPSLVTPTNIPARPVNIMPADKLTSQTIVPATALQHTKQTLEKPLIKISRKKTGGKKKIIIKLKKYEGKNISIYLKSGKKYKKVALKNSDIAKNKKKFVINLGKSKKVKTYKIKVRTSTTGTMGLITSPYSKIYTVKL